MKLLFCILDDFVRSDVTALAENETKMSTSIACRTIRIGSYKFESKEKVCASESISCSIINHLWLGSQVVLTCKGIKIVAPSHKNPKELVTLNIMHSEIIKLVVHFSKQLHIVFIYTKPSCARYIASELHMGTATDKSEFSLSSLHSQTLIFSSL